MYISKTKVSYPIQLSDSEILIKRSLAIDFTETEDDVFINSLIEEAIELTEGKVNFDIALTNNSIVIESFTGIDLIIPGGNLNSVTSIINNDSSALITSYSVKKDYSAFTISFDQQVTCEALTVNYTTGWAEYAEVPAALKRAILTKTADLFYKERGSYSFSSEEYNGAWEAQCQQFKLL